tara:strand:- start:334 stop:1749 length:1416 start_codon:yes stop_codon:yes gene_type:complete
MKSNSPVFDKVISDARKKDVEGNRVIVMWAQESTPAELNFLRNVEAYAKKIDAVIVIIAGRYKNPNSLYSVDENDVWWDKNIEGYLSLNRHNLTPHVSVLADVKVLPTATRPVNGFEGFEGETSLILGHPRIQMKTVATLEGYRMKEIWTTGACTKMNYTDSRAGKKGEFHHVIGFAIVEYDDDGKESYIRQVTADDDGSFCDLNYSVSKEEVTTINSIELYHCGDSHFGEEDPEMVDAGFDMIERLNPKSIRLDDVFNGHSISHWEKNLPITLYERFINGESLIKNEFQTLKNGLTRYVNLGKNIVIPRCNHDVFLDRYIDTNDWKRDIPNALEYMECASLLLRGLAPKGLIPYYIDSWFPDGNVVTLDGRKSHRILGHEQSIHGHKGANGSRGTVLQFTKLSTKMFTGHTHSPSRYDGVCTSGTNTHLRVGFNNQGASSWAQADQILHKNGKAQQLLFKSNYKCTTLFD